MLISPFGIYGSALEAPLLIPGLYAWYDASKITGLSDGQTVSAWDDSSGNARHLTIGSGTPVYKTNILLTKPAVLFANNGDLVKTGFGLSGACSIVTVHNWTSAKASNCMCGGQASTGFYIFNLGTQTNWSGGGSSVAAIAGETPPTGMSSYAFIFNGASSYVYKDNAAVVGPVGQTTFSGTDLWLGSAQNSTGNRYNGYIADFLVYNRAITALEVSALSSYFAVKYGLPL